MSSTYGPFLLQHLPLDAIKTEKQCLAILEQFAQLGLCPMFREVIQGRVVEFCYEASIVSYRWLDGSEAEAVLSVRNICGSVPYDYFDFLNGTGTLLTPTGMQRGAATLTLIEGSEYSFTTLPISLGITYIQELNQELSQQVQLYADFAETNTYRPLLVTLLDFQDELLESIDKCREAGVIFMLEVN